jgi:hypothetical protein
MTTRVISGGAGITDVASVRAGELPVSYFSDEVDEIPVCAKLMLLAKYLNWRVNTLTAYSS